MEKLDLHFLQTECNRGELAAFIGFAVSFPTSFLALVDTYNVLKYVNRLFFTYYRHILMGSNRLGAEYRTFALLRWR